MTIMAAIGTSLARGPIETLEASIESGVFLPIDWEFLGGGSLVNWIDGIDEGDPGHSRWDALEAGIINYGPVDAVWWQPLVRDPAVFTGEPYPSFDALRAMYDFALTITGSVPYFVSRPPSIQSCDSVKSEQHEISINYFKRALTFPGCEEGPEDFIPITENESEVDLCHGQPVIITSHALTLQEWFGVGGIAWS